MRWKPDSSKMILFLRYPDFKFFYFSLTIHLTFSIKVIIDNLLSVKVSSNGNALFFAQARQFLLLAENTQNCKCYCDCVSTVYKALGLKFSRKISFDNFLLYQYFVSIICCILFESFLHPLDEKYCSSTAPSVFCYFKLATFGKIGFLKIF